MHGAIMEALGLESDNLPGDRPLLFASYRATDPPVAYLEPLAVGHALPALPLFLTGEYYVPLPLETTYMAAVGGMPGFWREVLEGKRTAPEVSD